MLKGLVNKVVCGRIYAFTTNLSLLFHKRNFILCITCTVFLSHQPFKCIIIPPLSFVSYYCFNLVTIPPMLILAPNENSLIIMLLITLFNLNKGDFIRKKKKSFIPSNLEWKSYNYIFF